MEPRLRAAGLPIPDVFISADNVRRGKPDPEGYAMAARALGVDPRDCLVVEDAPVGIGAGLTAGAYVLAVATSHAADELASAGEYYLSKPRAFGAAPPAGYSRTNDTRFATVRDLEQCKFALDPDRIRIQTL